VLATVPGYPAAVRVWNWTGWSSSGCYPENRGTHRVRGRVGTGPRFHFTVTSTLAPIKYLSSDHIATWSIRDLCRLMPYFISLSQMDDWINIRGAAVKFSRKSRQNDRVFIATPWQLVRLQIAAQEIKEGIKLHISHIDYVTILSEHKYLIGVGKVDFCGWGLCGNPLQRSGSRSEPDPNPNQAFGPIANSSHKMAAPNSFSEIAQKRTPTASLTLFGHRLLGHLEFSL
jgi:hypothetical protein